MPISGTSTDTSPDVLQQQTVSGTTYVKYNVNITLQLLKRPIPDKIKKKFSDINKLKKLGKNCDAKIKRFFKSFLLISIIDYTGFTTYHTDEKLYESARKWFFEDNYGKITFSDVCAVLNLQPEIVREKLDEMTPEELRKVKNEAF